MSYTYTAFNGVDLSPLNAESTLDPPESVSGFVTTLAGGFDGFGNGEAPPRLPYMVQHRGVILEPTPSLSLAVLQGLRSRHRSIGPLWRQGDNGALEWATARLMTMPQTRTSKNKAHHEVTTIYEVHTEWHGLQRVYEQNLTTSPLTFAAVNNGNRTIRDAVLTISSGADVVRTLGVSVAGVSNIIWDGLEGGSLVPPLEPGRINPGETLVWRMGAKSIRWSAPNESGNVDGYYGLDIGVGHTIDDWLHIPPGETTVTVAFTKNPAADTGSGTATLEFYEGWK